MKTSKEEVALIIQQPEYLASPFHATCGSHAGILSPKGILKKRKHSRKWSCCIRASMQVANPIVPLK